MKNIFDVFAKYFIGEDYEDDAPENDTQAAPSDENEPTKGERITKRSKFQKAPKAEKEPEQERSRRYSSEPSSSSYTGYAGSARTSDADAAGRRSRLVNMGAVGNSSNMIITQISEYSDCRDVIKQLKERKSVIINVDQMDKVNARRAVDFLSGAVTAIDGDIKKIANSIIVVAPSNVKLTGIFGEEVPSNINDNNFGL